MIKVGEVFEMVRALMNDNAGAVYTDPVIIPYFKIAYEELRLDLEDYSIPIGILTSDGITVTAGITEVGGNGGPALPKNLIEVLEVYERTAGTDDNFIQMTRAIALPKTEVITSYLEVWSWQNQRIKLLGATGNIEIKLDFLAELPEINNENTVLELTNARLALASRTAALLAQFVEENEQRYEAAMAACVNAVDKMLNIKIKPQQRIPVRRRPFMAGAKVRSGRGY